MSPFSHLFRTTAAAVVFAIGTGSLLGQDRVVTPSTLPLIPDVSSPQNAVTPTSGFGNGPFRTRTAPAPGCPGPPAPACPCPVIGQPVAPGTPGTPDPTNPANPPVPQPNPPVAPPAPQAPDFGDLTRGAGVGPVVGLAPNMFGDLFGGRPSTITVPIFRAGVLNGQNVIATVPASSTSGSMVQGNLGSAVFTITGVPGQLGPYRALNGQLVTETVPGTNQKFTPASGATITNVLGYLAAAPGSTLPTVPPQVSAGLPPGQLYQFAAAYEMQQTPGAVLQKFTLGGVQALYTGSELEYLSRISSLISTPLVINVPNPGAGGVVGIVKVSEDNSPMPRDRFIFNYDYFNNVPLTTNGISVNRYQFGFEKTFFEGRTSLEIRLPFANTLSSNSVAGSDTMNTELGNLRLTAKGLLLRNRALNISTGLAISLPTSSDVSIRTADGTDMIHLDTSSVQLSPFIAALFTPTDRLFAQAWLSWLFDTGGNAVQVNPTYFNGASNIGSLRGPSLMSVDLQLGYWLYQASSGYLRGLAPFVELHYNGNISNGTVLATGNGFFIGDTNGNFNELNISSGFVARLAQNATLSVGAAAPLRTGNNRTFDYQIGVRFNWFFGYTARNQSRGTSVSSFQ